MRFRFLIVVLFLMYNARGYSNSTPLKMAADESFRHFFNTGKHSNILVTSKEIYVLSKSRYKQIAFPHAGFSDAFYTSDTLVILKKDTLFFLSVKDEFKSAERLVALKSLGPDLPAFNSVVVDSYGVIWICSTYGGVYTLQAREKSLLLRLTAPVINDLKVNRDSSVYAATNIGLFRYTTKSNTWIKYAEEALGGYEMPDNIIEAILVDYKNNIWVLMPEHIAFINYSNKNEIHVPSFDYLGDKDTRLLGISNFKAGYLMLTTKGILFLNKISEDETNGEVHTANNQTAVLLTKKDIGTPAVFDAQPVKFIGKNGKENFFFTAEGFWVVRD